MCCLCCCCCFGQMNIKSALEAHHKKKMIKHFWYFLSKWNLYDTKNRFSILIEYTIFRLIHNESFLLNSNNPTRKYSWIVLMMLIWFLIWSVKIQPCRYCVRQLFEPGLQCIFAQNQPTKYLITGVIRVWINIFNVDVFLIICIFHLNIFFPPS